MDDESMRFVVEGHGATRSRGLVGCRIEQLDSYDHKLMHANRAAGRDCAAMLRIWGFVLSRDDGSTVRLHPNYSNTKIQCKSGDPVQNHELPRTGKGGSSGRGTFRRYVGLQVDKTLRFDATKNPRTAPPQQPSSAPLAIANAASSSSAH